MQKYLRTSQQLCLWWQNPKHPFEVSKGQSVLFLLGKENWKFAPGVGVAKEEKRKNKWQTDCCKCP